MLIQKPKPNIWLLRDDGLNNNSNGSFSNMALAQEANDMNIKNTHKTSR